MTGKRSQHEVVDTDAAVHHMDGLDREIASLRKQVDDLTKENVKLKAVIGTQQQVEIDHYEKGKTRYVKGKKIKSMLEVVQRIHYGGWFIFIDKPLHPRFIDNWTMSQVRCAITGGRLFTAITEKTKKRYAREGRR